MTSAMGRRRSLGRASFVAVRTWELVPRHVRRAAAARVLEASRAMLAGDAVGCPACGATAAQYFRGRCPSCGSASRQRLIALFLRRELRVDDTAGVRILHFAPEPGLVQMLSKLPNVAYVPADLRPDAGHVKVDATDIWLEPGFDGVIISHVLEHIPDDAAAMTEIHRVLKPGGWALIVVPIAQSRTVTYEDDSISSSLARHRHFGRYDHVRLYGRDFGDRLRDAGFEVNERRYAGELPPAEVRYYGLSTRERIHLCLKP
jgi:SAM-dependent methyltransferase